MQVKKKDVESVPEELGTPTPPEEIINEGAETEAEIPEVDETEETESKKEPEEELKIDFSKLPPMVWIVKNSGKESYVSAQLAKTLIDKQFAKLK